jgi:hypothetical protein
MSTKRLLASAARTATVDSDDQSDPNAEAVHVAINVTSVTATPSVLPRIQGKDPESGVYYDVLVGLAITATGMTVLKVGPGLAPVANGAAADYLPDTWRVRMEHADADSITYSVGAVLAE